MSAQTRRIIPDNPGSYCLLIFLNKTKLIKIGKLGTIKFKKGYYVYVGSALSGLKNRIKRHLLTSQGKTKNLFWHIDYLLNDRKTKILEVWVKESKKKEECKIAKRIKGKPIVGFGSSDCTCLSHLFYFRRKPKILDGMKVMEIYQYSNRRL